MFLIYMIIIRSVDYFSNCCKSALKGDGGDMVASQSKPLKTSFSCAQIELICIILKSYSTDFLMTVPEKENVYHIVMELPNWSCHVASFCEDRCISI